MKTVTYYQCEICGAKFNDKDEALQCEKNHPSANNMTIIKVFDYTYYPPYPKEILVKMPNDKILSYTRSECQ